MNKIGKSLKSIPDCINTVHRRYIYRNKKYDKTLIFLLGVVSGIIICRSTCLIKPPVVEEIISEDESTEIAVVVETPAPPEHHNEAIQTARILYGLKDYNLSDKSKIAVIEVILNRASYGTEFPTTIMEVINQPNQWQGYVSDGMYLEEDYNLALSRYNDTSGARVIPEGCYFMTVSNSKVVVRTKWSGGNEWSVS